MRIGSFAYLATAALAVVLASTAPAGAGTVTMTFDEFPQDTDQIGSPYGGYNGINSQDGYQGPNDGVTFSSGAYISESYLDGGSGNFSGNPSGNNALAFANFNEPPFPSPPVPGGPYTMSFSPIFNLLSFYYASEACFVSTGYSSFCGAGNAADASVSIYGIGDVLLETVDLPDNIDQTLYELDTFTEVSLDISTQADEVVFNNVTSQYGGTTTYFDNVTLVPEPASLSLFLVGLGALGITRRRKTA